MIDWTKPLEAVHEDGRVVAQVYHKPSAITELQWTHDTPGLVGSWNPDGSHRDRGSPWRIRNVQPATAIPAAERPSDEVVERMTAFVRKHAAGEASGGATEARAITALLPIPIDPDLIEAREIACSVGDNASIMRLYRNGSMDDGQYIQGILAGIKYGRGA